MGQENIAGRWSQVAWRLIGHEVKEGRVRANFQLWAGGEGTCVCSQSVNYRRETGRPGDVSIQYRHCGWIGSRITQIKVPRKQWAIRAWGSGMGCKSVNKYFLRTPRCTGHARVDQRVLLRGSQGWRR